ncbi:toll/interleukin-1 receptor domain-containing protein [Glaciecola sp. 1036]|uniref:toll/interleukin-1 receptor domain-containing protein n=1 Tax=Alteromonadaceae TaxID=72275 RepID=UPI003D0937DE
MNENIDVYDAFISHASEDSERALEIVASLEQQGLKCWIDKRDIRAGKKYAEEIVRGVRQSRCVVVVISRHSNASDNVAAEAEEARKSGKPIFPVRVEDVQPSEKLTFYVSINQWLDLWNADKVGKLEQLAKSIVDPEALANSIIPKPSNLLQYLKNNRLSLLGFAILSITIGVGFWMIKADIGDYANPFGVELPENIDPEDFEKENITVIASPSVSEITAFVTFTVMPDLHSMAYVQFIDAEYQLKFSSGLEIKQFSPPGFSTAVDTGFDNIPDWVSVQITLRNGVVIGPFTYDLGGLSEDILAKRKDLIDRERMREIDMEKKRLDGYLDNIKDRFSEGYVVLCYEYFGSFSQCKITASMELPINKTFESITFFSADINKPIKLDFNPIRKSPDVLILGSEASNELRLILTIPLKDLAYSAVFSDGEKSVTHRADADYRDSNKNLTFEFEPLSEHAPRLFTTSEPSGGYYKERSKWSLLPFVDSAQEIYWTTYDGGKNLLEKGEIGQFQAKRISAPELGVTYDGADGSILQLSVIDKTGDAETFKYKANWAEWIPSAASASIKFRNNFIQCRVHKIHNTIIRFTICGMNVSEPFMRVFNRVEWGLTSSDLSLYKGYDLDVQFKNMETEITEYFERKKKSGELDESSIETQQEYTRTHIETFKKRLKLIKASRGTPEYLIMLKTPEAIFFKFSLVNGEQSPVLRAVVKK